MRSRATSNPSYLLALALASALSTSCGEDTSRRTSGAPFTVWVFDESTTPGGAPTPIAGVRVAFDDASGARVEKTTNAEGSVVYEGNFANGGVSVSVLSDEHVYMTMLEASPDTARARPNTLGKPPGDLVIIPPRLDAVADRTNVGLRGTIAGKREADNLVRLAASGMRRRGVVETTVPSYVMRAPRDQSFFLLGHERRVSYAEDGALSNELVKSFRIDLPPRAVDDLLDLDLATIAVVPSRPIRVRAVVPAGPTFAGAKTRAAASVVSSESGIAPGTFVRATRAADGTAFDVDVDLVEGDFGERLLSEVTLTSEDGARTTRIEDGPLKDGASFEFDLPPSLPGADRARSVREPLSLDAFPAGAELYVEVYAAKTRLWILHGPPGGPRAKSFVVPYRNEVNAPLVAVFAVSVSARRERVEVPGGGEFYRYTSTFKDVLVSKR